MPVLTGTLNFKLEIFCLHLEKRVRLDVQFCFEFIRKKCKNYSALASAGFFFNCERISICVALPFDPKSVFNIWSAEIRTRFRAGFLNFSRKRSKYF